MELLRHRNLTLFTTIQPHRQKSFTLSFGVRINKESSLYRRLPLCSLRTKEAEGIYLIHHYHIILLKDNFEQYFPHLGVWLV